MLAPSGAPPHDAKGEIEEQDIEAEKAGHRPGAGQREADAHQRR